MIYKLHLSNSKDTLRLTEDEYKKFKDNIGLSFIEFSEGIVNPSFVVSITIDREGTREENMKLGRGHAQLPAHNERGTQTMKEVLEKNRPQFLLGEES